MAIDSAVLNEQVNLGGVQAFDGMRFDWDQVKEGCYKVKTGTELKGTKNPLYYKLPFELLDGAFAGIQGAALISLDLKDEKHAGKNKLMYIGKFKSLLTALGHDSTVTEGPVTIAESLFTERESMVYFKPPHLCEPSADGKQYPSFDFITEEQADQKTKEIAARAAQGGDATEGMTLDKPSGVAQPTSSAAAAVMSKPSSRPALG